MKRHLKKDGDSSHCEKLENGYYQTKSFEFGNIEAHELEAYVRLTVGLDCAIQHRYEAPDNL